jgi:hypothetical protein
MDAQLFMIVTVILLDVQRGNDPRDRFLIRFTSLDCSVHSLDLTVSPWMVGFAHLSRRGDDADLRDAIKRVFRERRRFGYRRIHVMVAHEAFDVKQMTVRRIYTEEKLQVRRRGGRKRA